MGAYLDTGATTSLVSSRFVRYGDLVPINICGVKRKKGESLSPKAR